jgi:hypothetical protein
MTIIIDLIDESRTFEKVYEFENDGKYFTIKMIGSDGIVKQSYLNEDIVKFKIFS